MEKKLFYLQKFGQLGNQLSILAHLIAFGKECGYQIIFPLSKEISGILQTPLNLCAPILILRPFTGVYRFFWFTKFLKLLGICKNIYLNKTAIINATFTVDDNLQIKSAKRIFLLNWLFRYYSGVKKHQEYVRTTLAFKKDLIVEADKFIKRIKNENRTKTLIGIHVRRGDYLTWQEGKYYYEDSDYYGKMAEIAELLPGSIFIISSNEPVNFHNHKQYIIYYCNGSALEDLYSLSCCDYIMGPPSTFSGWAAFMGNTPLYFIENKNKIKSMDLFKPYFL